MVVGFVGERSGLAEEQNCTGWVSAKSNVGLLGLPRSEVGIGLAGLRRRTTLFGGVAGGRSWFGWATGRVGLGSPEATLAWLDLRLLGLTAE